MFSRVDTSDPTAVEVEVQTAYGWMFPDSDRLFVARAFGWAIECFTGQYPDYQKVDAGYHDLEHTLQGTLCLARLLCGRHRAGAEPRLDERGFQLAILAILLHDTGYLKKRDDTDGTGAKYTITHVHRSAEFAARLLTEKGLPERDIHAVQQMIRCTGLDTVPASISFETELDRHCGYALATADFLGQLAAEDYLDKLPTLYGEFAEATRFSNLPDHFVASFTSAEDLFRRTPTFWEQNVRPRLIQDFQGLYRFLNDPYPDGPNEYLQRVEANIARVKAHLG